MSKAKFFTVGDMVETTADYEIDYSACLDEEERSRRYEHGEPIAFRIPAGSCGVVISKQNVIGTEDKQAVCFYDVPNWDCLYYSNHFEQVEEHEIGPGHYIPVRMLRLLEDFRDFEPASIIDDLF